MAGSFTSQPSSYPRGINRIHSPVLARALPWLTVALGSLLPQWIAVASAPLVPPLGYLMLLSWRQLHPGALPVWAGLPLGLFDDLYSGQPLGTGVMLWSLTMVAMEALEMRFPWRSFVVDWLVASAAIVLCLFAGLAASSMSGAQVSALVIVPQLLLSILCYPLAGRLVGWADRLRLARFRALL